MPYIKPQDRQYSELIETTVLTIVRNSMPPMVRAEYFGYWVARLCEHYMNAQPMTNLFNSTGFNSGHKKQLEDLATKIASAIGQDQPIMTAGNLNYVISSVWWGICGDHTEADQAGYGFRCVTRGMLEQFLSTLNSTKFNASGSPDAQHLRRAVTVRGVLNDVISECYRRKTTPYEETKIEENGDIWNEGKLVTA